VLQRYKLISYHLIFWLLYMLLGSLMEYATNPKSYNFSAADMLFTHLPNICTVYLSILVCKKWAKPLKVLPLLIGLCIVYICSFFNWFFTAYYIRPLINANGAALGQIDYFHFGITVLWVFVRYAVFGFGYYYASETIEHERKLRLIEKEKHEAEYAFLRAQINPHFLNNTLNFFFAKSLPLSPELADGILTLSEIMRYSLEMDKDDRLTLIEEEIAHINNVIKINQLRFNNKLEIDFNINGNTSSVKVIPLILITIVENILKHGNCTEKTHPVKIALNINDNDIQLKTWNLKKNGPKELSSGIGMENIQKRLSNHYKNQFSININETELDYSLELTLPYNKVINHQEKPTSTDHLSFMQHFKLAQIKPQPYTS